MSKNDAAQEYNEMRARYELENQDKKQPGVKECLSDKRYRRATLMCIVLAIFN